MLETELSWHCLFSVLVCTSSTFVSCFFPPKNSPGMARTPHAMYFRLFPYLMESTVYRNCLVLAHESQLWASSRIHVQWQHTASFTSIMVISKCYKSRCFVFFVFFSWKVKHLLAQKAKNIDGPSREAPCVLAWPSQSSGNHFTFWGERWGSQGWDMPTSESSRAGHPALQILLALAKYTFHGLDYPQQHTSGITTLLKAPTARESWLIPAGTTCMSVLLCFEKEVINYQDFMSEAATGFISNRDIIQWFFNISGYFNNT